MYLDQDNLKKLFIGVAGTIHIMIKYKKNNLI